MYLQTDGGICGGSVNVSYETYDSTNIIHVLI